MSEATAEGEGSARLIKPECAGLASGGGGVTALECNRPGSAPDQRADGEDGAEGAKAQPSNSRLLRLVLREPPRV